MQKIGMMIQRDAYLNRLMSVRGNGQAKVITGPRRAGKSFLLNEIFYRRLLEEGVRLDHVIRIDLDDPLNYGLWDPLSLSEHIASLLKDDDVHYVLIDEIQNVYSIKNPALEEGRRVRAKQGEEGSIGFSNVILGLSKRPNVDLYVTGSNSRMLSKDIVTEFRDKGVEIHVSPLSFFEFSQGASPMEEQAKFAEYMRFGGMPLAVLARNPEDKQRYLSALFEATYLRDVVERGRFQSEEDVRETMRVVASTVGELTNAERIANTFQSVKKHRLDGKTISSYIDAYEDAFLIREAERYDVKGRSFIGAARKYYFSDLGLRNAVLSWNHDDDGAVMENVIYNELAYRGYEVSVGVVPESRLIDGVCKRVPLEMDFVARKGGAVLYVQSCFRVGGDGTAMREKRPFIKAKDSYPRYLVVRDPIPRQIDENGILTVGVVEFLRILDRMS